MFNWIKNLFFGEEKASGVRARNKKGQYVKDDPNTPDVNEAYADGKTPVKKRGRPKGSKKKK